MRHRWVRMGPTPTIEYRYQVMFFDTDCAAVGHNLAYLRMIETARTMLAAELGLDMPALAERGVFPVLLGTEVEYKKPAKLMDTLLIRGSLDAIQGVRFWVAFEIVHPDDGAVYVECRQSLALIQMPAGKPLRLPEEWTTRFAHLRRAPGR